MQQPKIPQGTINAYYTFLLPIKVTIESENGLVSTMTFPPNIMLNVQFYLKDNPDYKGLKGKPLLFRGDIIIRARRSDEIKPGESRASHALMSKAPYEIHIYDCVIFLEKL